jgi:hypothetical protein
MKGPRANPNERENEGESETQQHWGQSRCEDAYLSLAQLGQ